MLTVSEIQTNVRNDYKHLFSARSLSVLEPHSPLCMCKERTSCRYCCHTRDISINIGANSLSTALPKRFAAQGTLAPATQQRSNICRTLSQCKRGNSTDLRNRKIARAVPK